MQYIITYVFLSYCTILHNAVLYYIDTMLCRMILYCSVLYYSILFDALLFHFMLYFIILYCVFRSGAAYPDKWLSQNFGCTQLLNIVAYDVPVFFAYTDPDPKLTPDPNPLCVCVCLIEHVFGKESRLLVSDGLFTV